jgi:FAD/FMN-containing dehydrogenase
MNAAGAIAALQVAFPSDQIALPGTAEYETRNGSYLSQLESDILPACIFQPKTRGEVSQFVQIIKPFAANVETAFAIRAAGNMPSPGCANVQGGITLDLGLLTGIELNNGVVSVAAGESWAAVDETVQAAGLAVTGGRSGTGGLEGWLWRVCIRVIRASTVSYPHA